MNSFPHVFINGIRHYETPVGNLPGVTSILSETKSKNDKYGITRWKQQVGEDVANSILNNSIERGNLFHQSIENYLIDAFKDITETTDHSQGIELFGLIKSWLDDIKKENTTETLFIENPTYYPAGFAGTPDLICKYKGKWTIMDWKNSRKPKKRTYIQDYLLQVSAYRKSFEHMNPNIQIEQAFVVCGVLADPYLEVTNPGMVVEPELQKFKVTTKQLDSYWLKFEKRMKKFHNPQVNYYDFNENSDIPW